MCSLHMASHIHNFELCSYNFWGHMVTLGLNDDVDAIFPGLLWKIKQ